MTTDRIDRADERAIVLVGTHEPLRLFDPRVSPSSEEAAQAKAVGTWVCTEFTELNPNLTFKGLVTFRADGTYLRFVTFEDLDIAFRRHGYELTDEGTWTVGRDDAGYLAMMLTAEVKRGERACREAPSDTVAERCLVHHDPTRTAFRFDGWTDAGLGATLTEGGSEAQRTCTYRRQGFTYDPDAPPPPPLFDDAPPEPTPEPAPEPEPAVEAPLEKAPEPVDPAEALRAELKSGRIGTGADSQLLALYRAFRDDLNCDASSIRLDAASLRILRNTPYAEQGYAFSSPDLAAVFGAQPWYSPTPGVDKHNPPVLTGADDTCVKALRAAEPSL